MGRPLIDLVGQRFGRLFVVEYLGRRHHSSRWRCVCDCGNKIEANASSLKTGDCLSCGCYRRDRMGVLNLTHGMSGIPEHKVWDSMIQRCCNSSARDYKHYGARGIKVCERWANFSLFFADMGKRPSKAYSLERINVNGDYEPSNCRWATAREQCRNKRSNTIVHFDGRDMTLIEASEITGIPYKTLKCRVQKGWSVERALRTPVSMARVDAQRRCRSSG